MAPISLKKGKIDDFAKDLVRSVTNFSSDSENLKISTEFVLSNFRFNKFLDVNSFDVARKLDGLKDKFKIHCQEAKAERLQTLKAEFLQSPFSSSLFSANTESHFGILSVLLNLSESPVNHEYSSPKKVDASDADDINWTEYLLEGEETLELGIPTSSDEQRFGFNDSDDDDDDDFFEQTTQNDKFETEEGKTASSRLVGLEGRTEETFPEYEQEEKDLQWLQQNIIPQYWTGSDMHVQGYDTEHQQSWIMNTLAIADVNAPTMTNLTEKIMIRETLWMLKGIETTFVYRYVDGRYIVQNNVSMIHVTHKALQNILLSYASTGNKIQELKKFISDALDIQKPSLKTVRAFAYSINCFMKKTRKQLCDIENEIVKQNKVYTHLTLRQEINDMLLNIDLIFDLYSSCILETKEVEIPSANHCVIHILDSCFQALCKLDTCGSAAINQTTLVLPIFLETIRPLLGDLASWISNGKLPSVGSDEFFIYKDETITKDDSEAWRLLFGIRNYGGDQTNKLAVPVFLLDVIDKILLTGKSRGILEKAGNDIGEVSTTSFEEELYGNFFEALGISRKVVDEEDVVEDSAMVIAKKKLTVIGDEFNQLLTENVIVLFQQRYEKFKRTDPIDNRPRSIQEIVDENFSEFAKTSSGRSPLKLVFESAIQALVNERYAQASSSLIDLLKGRFKFKEQFSMMKNFFLMEAGDILEIFYSEIFSKIRAKEYWQSTSYLTSILHEALLLRFPKLVNALTVGIRTPPEARNAAKSSNQSIDVIFLHYKMSWPLTIIFDSKAEERYNAVFSFLLQVKRAVWSLQRLRVTELCSTSNDDNNVRDPLHVSRSSAIEAEDNTGLGQKIYVLRVRLMHFVQSFHVYIMTRILHSSGLEFEAQLAEAKDFEEVLTCHQEYIEKVYDRCLLSPKVGFAKEAIMRILNLCLNFQQQWDLGLYRINGDKISAIENEFVRCSHFIQSFLKNLIKRGSFPHLELLALSLRS